MRTYESKPISYIHPPGVPPDQTPHLQSQQNEYYPPQSQAQGSLENQQQLNPAAATAAIAALSQFTGHPPIGQSPYRGGGRRGGRPFRGGGRGHFRALLFLALPSDSSLVIAPFFLELPVDSSLAIAPFFQALLANCSLAIAPLFLTLLAIGRIPMLAG
nr:hypothetical protein CFP56_43392 [Quercus suber]